MQSAKHDKPLFAETDRLEQLPEGVRFRQAEVWAGLESKLRQRRRRGVILLRLSIAAMLLLTLAIGWWILPRLKSKEQEVAIQEKEAVKMTAQVAATKKQNAFKQAPAPSQQRVAVEIRKASQTGLTPAPQHTIAPLIAQAPSPVAIDTPRFTEVAVSTPQTVTPTRRFRIGHLNENGVQTPEMTDVPADDRSTNGLIHIPLTGAAGPNAGAAEPLERKPRTLMSLFKPHQ